MRPNPWKFYPGCLKRYKNCLPSCCWSGPCCSSFSFLCWCFMLIFNLCLVYSKLPMSLDCPFLISPYRYIYRLISLFWDTIRWKLTVLNIELLRSFILTYHNIPHSLLLVCFLVMLKLFGTMYICFVFESHSNVEKWTRSIFKVVIWSRAIFSKKLLTISTKYWTVIDICYFVVYMSLLCTIIFVMSFFTFNVIFLVCRFSRYIFCDQESHVLTTG